MLSRRLTQVIERNAQRIDEPTVGITTVKFGRWTVENVNIGQNSGI